jgi:hypothetical protein
LAIYTPTEWPSRRTKILLQILEITYHSAAEPVRRRASEFEQTGQEIQRLVSFSVSLSLQ